MKDTTPHKLNKKCIDCGKEIADRSTRCQKCYRKVSTWSGTGKSL